VTVGWIEHKGKKILFIDYRGLDEEGMLEALESATEIILGSTAKKLILVDVTGTTTTREFMTRLREGGTEIKPVTEKQAVVGITGLKGFLLDAYNWATGATLRSFPTQDEAKEWLVGP
jgi:hypothetical protein